MTSFRSARSRTPCSRQSKPHQGRRFRPCLEELERRVLLNGDTFVVPGVAGTTTTVQFTWTARDAAFRDEVGVYMVDNAQGAVGGVAPDSPGYAQAVLNNGTRQTIFEAGTGPGTQRTISFTAGARLAFYMTQDTTSATFLAMNPLNKGDSGPLTFFSVPRGNPDGLDHL